MEVKNINGTVDKFCKCGSWLDHWMNYSGQRLPVYCPVAGCYEKAEVGAHIQRDTPADYSWYIVPLCKRHNAQMGQPLKIGNYIILVPANVRLTCDRK